MTRGAFGVIIHLMVRLNQIFETGVNKMKSDMNYTKDDILKGRIRAPDYHTHQSLMAQLRNPKWRNNETYDEYFDRTFPTK